MILTCEKAKELKDAGFKQNGKSNEGDDGYAIGPVVYNDGIEFNKVAYIPTLSELIEACGDEFLSVKMHKKMIWHSDKGENEYVFMYWIARADYKKAVITPAIETIGGTPEEAVANLWLALNKK